MSRERNSRDDRRGGRVLLDPLYGPLNGTGPLRAGVVSCKDGLFVFRLTQYESPLRLVSVSLSSVLVDCVQAPSLLWLHSWSRWRAGGCPSVPLHNNTSKGFRLAIGTCLQLYSFAALSWPLCGRISSAQLYSLTARQIQLSRLWPLLEQRSTLLLCVLSELMVCQWPSLCEIAERSQRQQQSETVK